MLPRSKRVGKSDFRDIAGKRPESINHYPQFLVKFYSNPVFKATVVISKSTISASSKRNIVKRRLRDLIYKNISTFKPGLYIFIVKPVSDFNEYDYEKLSTSFNNFLSENN